MWFGEMKNKNKIKQEKIKRFSQFLKAHISEMPSMIKLNLGM